MKRLIVTPLIFEDQVNLLPQINLIKNYEINYCYSVEISWLTRGVSFDWMNVN